VWKAPDQKNEVWELEFVEIVNDRTHLKIKLKGLLSDESTVFN
jgi:hypothetical protein